MKTVLGSSPSHHLEAATLTPVEAGPLLPL